VGVLGREAGGVIDIASRSRCFRIKDSVLEYERDRGSVSENPGRETFDHSCLVEYPAGRFCSVWRDCLMTVEVAIKNT